MGAGFESQWDAAWFQARAEQCFRLARSMMLQTDADALKALGLELQAQAVVAQNLQDKKSTPKPSLV